jgi:hypothetical protein
LTWFPAIETDAESTLEPVIDLNRSMAIRFGDEHDKEVVSQRRNGRGVGVFVAVSDVDA